MADSFDDIFGAAADGAYDDFFAESVTYTPELTGDPETILMRISDHPQDYEEHDGFGEMDVHYAEATFDLDVIVDPQVGDTVTRDEVDWTVHRILEHEHSGRCRVQLKRFVRRNVRGEGTVRNRRR